MKLDDLHNWSISVIPLPLPEIDSFDHQKLRKALEESKVYLRGWSFPYVGNRAEDISNTNDGIRLSCDWILHPEGSYAMTNGIFVHRQALREDVERNWGLGPGKWIDFVNTVWTVYEFFLFFSRYYTHLEHSGSLNINIELAGLQGRELHSPEVFLRWLPPAKENTFIYKKTLSEKEWRSESQAASVACTKKLFALFGWLDAEPQMIMSWQERLANKKY